MRLYGDYSESKSQRFLVQLFGAMGWWLVCYWGISVIANLVGMFEGPMFHVVVLSIGGSVAFWYVRHEWREGRRIERQLEESVVQSKLTSPSRNRYNRELGDGSKDGIMSGKMS